MPHTPNNPRTGKLLLFAAALALACLHAPAQTAPKPSPAQPFAPRNTSVPAFGGQAQSAPVAAPAPNWPVNQTPAPAQIKWDSQGLRVSAANSSLRQILTEISTRTGAKLEGLTGDERVFGEYGPGPAREVLAQILHGSSYNIMLIGDQGEGTPRQIVLSRRTATARAAQPNATPNSESQDSDDDSADPTPEEPPQPQQPPQPAQPPVPQQPGETTPGPRRVGVPIQPPPQQPQE